MVVILHWLSDLMAKVLVFLYDNVVHNYGWDIVLLTLLIKIILFPTSISQVRSMEVMKVLQPKIKELQDKYKDNPQEMQRRMMELYREHKANPLGGCLPLLIQLPILFALFGLLRTPEKFGLALQKEYFLGLELMARGNTKDILGSMGHLILAALSAGSTFLQTKMTSPSQGGSTEAAASMQNTFLYFMPLFFGYITFTMEAAIGIYWVAQAIIGIVQQLLIVRFFVHPVKADTKDEKPRKSRDRR